MKANDMRVRAIYSERKLAIQAAADWYGQSVAFLPIKEHKRIPTTLFEPNDHDSSLGKIQYRPRTKDYALWVYPRSRTFRHIEAGDRVYIASKGWGIAIIPNLEQEVWACTNGIASDKNVKWVKKVQTRTSRTYATG